MQVLAKAAPKALHPLWVVLLPVHTPLATRPAARTLMDVIVGEPVPKVRSLKCGLSTTRSGCQPLYILQRHASKRDV